MLSIILVKPLISTALAASFFVVPQLPAPSIIATCDIDSKSKECVIELIKKYATLYDVSEKIALNVADCESDFRVDVYGDGGRAYGPYQFHKKTFELFSKKFGEELDYFDLEDNVRLAIWALSKNKGYHWSCYKKISIR